MLQKVFSLIDFLLVLLRVEPRQVTMLGLRELRIVGQCSLGWFWN